MFKRITPQTIADWGERIYIRFLELTKRFTSTQIMALLAVIVGIVESVMARLRMDRVPFLLGSASAMAALALILTQAR